MKKLIAWGNSKLLQMYLLKIKNKPFAYVIDNFTNKTEIAGIPILKSDALAVEKPDTFCVVIFAVSNASLQAILHQLNQMGLRYGKEYLLYSDYFLNNFMENFRHRLGWLPNRNLYNYSLSFTLNSRKLIHTTILGTWLFLEIIKKTSGVKGEIAELGAYEGGNVLCALNFANILGFPTRKYYIFDSFEGFPDLSKYDPLIFKKGDYNTNVSFQEICDNFAMFSNALVIKGYIPETFTQIPESTHFSLVFYDCDLYKPALDTYKYFWDKITSGGYLLIHDYETEPGGFTGVKKATDEFFYGKEISIISFTENTMAVIKKP
ncbi:MAG: TylF/MycF/NovP-related O-methyltransferase [Candidatus Brocadiaceae bacterium]